MSGTSAPGRQTVLVDDFQEFDGQRIGILGGSFDPVHTGHLAIARAVFRHHTLDRIVFVPAKQNPLKTKSPRATPDERVEMLCAAIRSEPAFAVSRIELDRRGQSYSVETARTIRAQAPSAEIFWIAGMDTLIDPPGSRSSLAHWHEKDEFLSIVHFVVCTRRTDDFELDPASLIERLPSEYYTPEQVAAFRQYSVPMPPVDVSATDLRKSLQRGEIDLPALPEPVRQLLKQSNPYSGKK